MNVIIVRRARSRVSASSDNYSKAMIILFKIWKRRKLHAVDLLTSNENWGVSGEKFMLGSEGHLQHGVMRDDTSPLQQTRYADPTLV